MTRRGRDRLHALLALHAVRVVCDVRHALHGAQPREVQQLVDAARRKARCRREHAEHALGADLCDARSHAIDVSTQLVALEHVLHHEWHAARRGHRLQARLLVDARPDDVECPRAAQLAQREHGESDGHTGGHREHQTLAHIGRTRSTQRVACERVRELVYQRGAGGFRLLLRDVARPADAMTKAEVARRDHWADHTSLALAHTRIADKGIRVHQRELVQQQAQRPVVPAHIRQAALLQQRTEERRARVASLLRLPDIRRRYELLGQGEGVVVHALTTRCVCGTARATPTAPPPRSTGWLQRYWYEFRYMQVHVHRCTHAVGSAHCPF